MLFENKKLNRYNPFHSFWMAGYECTDKLNCFGNRVDFLTVTGHLEKVDDDYRDLSLFKMKTVREGVCWSVVEKVPYQYDFSRVEKLIRSGREHGIQQVWDICHFGFPDDLTPLHPMFARRFAAICRAFVKFYRSIDEDSELIVTPFNEVSFLSWLGGDVCGTSPYCHGHGWHVKYAIMRAYIEGIEAMKEEDSTVRIMSTEPLINVVPPLDATHDQVALADKVNNSQFEVFEILSGRLCPELRGRPEYLDIIGSNYYFNNQWEIESYEMIPWKNELNDPRWKSLSELIKNLYLRYESPIVLSETSFPGEDKARWIEFISGECGKLLDEGIPLWGICWYPMIDRPDWDHLTPWHKAGIWDVEISTDGALNRKLDEAAAIALHEAQSSLQRLSVH